MKLARMTLGLAPAKMPNSTAAATRAQRRLRSGKPLSARPTAPKTIATFQPERATMWPRPVAVNAVARRSSTLSRRPMVIAAASPPAGAGITRSMSSPNLLRMISMKFLWSCRRTLRVCAEALNPRTLRRSIEESLSSAKSNWHSISSPTNSCGFGGVLTSTRAEPNSTMTRCSPRKGASTAATVTCTFGGSTARSRAASMAGSGRPPRLTLIPTSPTPSSAARTRGEMVPLAANATAPQMAKRCARRSRRPPGSGRMNRCAATIAQIATVPARPPSLPSGNAGKTLTE